MHRRIAERTFADAGVADLRHHRDTRWRRRRSNAPTWCSWTDPVVDPARLREDCLLIDDAVKRTFRGAAITALEPLRNPSGDTDAALRLARQRYRDAAAELLGATRNEDVRISSQ